MFQLVQSNSGLYGLLINNEVILSELFYMIMYKLHKRTRVPFDTSWKETGIYLSETEWRKNTMDLESTKKFFNVLNLRTKYR